MLPNLGSLNLVISFILCVISWTGLKSVIKEQLNLERIILFIASVISYGYRSHTIFFVNLVYEP